MEKKEGFGFIKLAKKTLAVIATSLSALTIDQRNALPATSKIDEVSKNINNERFQNNISKPQLILKLNQGNPNLAMIPSHGSHSSHSSHSSHASSSPSSSYTPKTPSKTDTTAQSTYK